MVEWYCEWRSQSKLDYHVESQDEKHHQDVAHYHKGFLFLKNTKKISNDSKSRWINYVRRLHGLSYIQYIAYNNDEGPRPFKALSCWKSRRPQNFPGNSSEYVLIMCCLHGWKFTRNIIEWMQIMITWDSHKLKLYALCTVWVNVVSWKIFFPLIIKQKSTQNPTWISGWDSMRVWSYSWAVPCLN